MSKIKKIVFVLPSMSGGGSQKVISILLNHIDRDKFKLYLILLEKKGAYLDDIPTDIEIVDLKTTRRQKAIVKLIKHIKLLQPDILFSTIGSMNMVISLIIKFLPKNIKFIARESGIVSLTNKNDKHPKIFDFIYRTFFNNFDIIIAQSSYMRQDLLDNYHIQKDKIRLINNPLDIKKIDKNLYSPKELLQQEKINLLSVGRMNFVKRFEAQLYLLSKLDSQFHLTLLGEGEEEEKLKQLAKELKIEDRVSFLGFQPNPYQYMQQADIFLLTSRYEAFPNVLLEANYCGLPIVAFDCSGGVGEIVEDNFNGFLVKDGDIELLKKSIEKAVAKYPFDRVKIKKSIIKKYRVTDIVNRYEELFDDVLQC